MTRDGSISLEMSVSIWRNFWVLVLSDYLFLECSMMGCLVSLARTDGSDIKDMWTRRFFCIYTLYHAWAAYLLLASLNRRHEMNNFTST
jgi:hypothetical protein